MLDNLSNATLDEVDAMSVDAVFDEKENVIFDPDNCYEENGLRIFKHHLKIDFGLWAFFLNDRNSLIYSDGSDYVYVFVMSISREFNDRLVDLCRNEQSSNKGYSFLLWYPDVTVTSVT